MSIFQRFANWLRSRLQYNKCYHHVCRVTSNMEVDESDTEIHSITLAFSQHTYGIDVLRGNSDGNPLPNRPQRNICYHIVSQTTYCTIEVDESDPTIHLPTLAFRNKLKSLSFYVQSSGLGSSYRTPLRCMPSKRVPREQFDRSPVVVPSRRTTHEQGVTTVLSRLFEVNHAKPNIVCYLDRSVSDVRGICISPELSPPHASTGAGSATFWSQRP